ncbi:hypothetical protein ACOTTU_12205 [Roseobacter sp. EG26]|uniref:hypothetical protein n=1 Tax=Roseobacter sp. EG26 TaxID=3412477 RepID=UPI00260F630C|nr:hypothetical protein [uncultured Roseobacter sp.]
MADNEHTHGDKHLTLEDVQLIIGRAMVDESFRSEFTRAPKETLKKLHISATVGGKEDEKTMKLINALAEAFSDKCSGATLQEALENIRNSYLQSTDGVIRPRCG